MIFSFKCINKHIFCSLLLIFFLQEAQSQNNITGLENKIIQSTFNAYTFKKPIKRNILNIKQSQASKINPLVYVSAGLLYFYQNIISEQIMADCMYVISCSQYTKLSIQQKGLFKGALSGVNQLTECFPEVIYDYPEYKWSNNHKVNNHIE